MQIRYIPLTVRVLVLVVVSLGMLIGGVLAHPPADVVISYDDTTGDLIVSVTHQVDDPIKHYIEKVTVKLDETILINPVYTSQPDRTSFTYRYNLPQLKGSSGDVRVDLQCSQFGSRSGTLTLHGASTPVAPGNAVPASTAPAKSPICVYAAIIAVGFVATRILRQS
jgi:hypothetical protein